MNTGVAVAVLMARDHQGISRSAARLEKLTPLKVGLPGRRDFRHRVLCLSHSRGPRAGRREAFDAGCRRRQPRFLVAMRFGLARGMYANEAGYGTAAVAYGTAQSRRPVQQD
jgi:AGCS family alanine or glycine:cation symporter